MAAETSQNWRVWVIICTRVHTLFWAWGVISKYPPKKSTDILNLDIYPRVFLKFEDPYPLGCFELKRPVEIREIRFKPWAPGQGLGEARAMKERVGGERRPDKQSMWDRIHKRQWWESPRQFAAVPQRFRWRLPYLFCPSIVAISSQHDMTDKASRHDGLGGKTDDNKNEEENETRRRNAMRGRNEMSRWSWHRSSTVQHITIMTYCWFLIKRRYWYVCLL